MTETGGYMRLGVTSNWLTLDIQEPMRVDNKQQVAQGREVIGSDREQFLLLDCVKPSSQPHVCHVPLMLHALWHMASMLHNHPFL